MLVKGKYLTGPGSQAAETTSVSWGNTQPAISALQRDFKQIIFLTKSDLMVLGCPNPFPVAPHRRLPNQGELKIYEVSSPLAHSPLLPLFLPPSFPF